MTAFTASVLACLLSATPPDARAPLVLRAAVVAGRATVVVATDQPLGLAVDLTKTACDGPGGATVAVIDVAPPWARASLRFPAGGRRYGRPYPDVLLRHSHSRYGMHVSSHRWTMDAGQEYAPALASTSLQRLEQANWKEFGTVKYDVTGWNSFVYDTGSGPDFDPVNNLHRQTGGREAPPGKSPLWYDFLVNTAAECELYVAAPGGEVECHVKSVLSSRQGSKLGDSILQPWAKTYAVPTSVTGPFAVVPHRKSRYLVTPAGAVVKICDDGKPLAKAAVVYDKSPVKAVVHDADEDKRYAFTATHYFEVAEPLVLKPHEVKRFDTSNGAAGLETAFHCARAVRGLPPAPFPAEPAKAPGK